MPGTVGAGRNATSLCSGANGPGGGIAGQQGHGADVPPEATENATIAADAGWGSLRAIIGRAVTPLGQSEGDEHQAVQLASSKWPQIKAFMVDAAIQSTAATHAKLHGDGEERAMREQQAWLAKARGRP